MVLAQMNPSKLLSIFFVRFFVHLKTALFDSNSYQHSICPKISLYFAESTQEYISYQLSISGFVQNGLVVSSDNLKAKTNRHEKDTLNLEEQIASIKYHDMHCYPETKMETQTGLKTTNSCSCHGWDLVKPLKLQYDRGSLEDSFELDSQGEKNTELLQTGTFRT